MPPMVGALLAAEKGGAGGSAAVAAEKGGAGGSAAVAAEKGGAGGSAAVAAEKVGRALAMGWGVPAIGVHHMEGHLLAPMLEAEPPSFPFVALLVSGGHTQLVRVDGIGEYELLGESLDDAAGEAFDKVGKMLGLPYPGGPHVAQLADDGVEKRFVFPRPMVKHPGLELRFSGLKTLCAIPLPNIPMLRRQS